MFYSESILSRKGPLANIWLAATWDRKLSKATVCQTDIRKSVDAILSDKSQPKALRLTGKLLYGVSVIHSRKTKYLLDDCSDAMLRIKTAFRPGVVDLPSDHLIANNTAAITLAQPLQEATFDIMMPEPEFNLADWELPPQMTGLRAVSYNDITLPDENDYDAISISSRFSNREIEVGRNVAVDLPLSSPSLFSREGSHAPSFTRGGSVGLSGRGPQLFGMASDEDVKALQEAMDSMEKENVEMLAREPETLRREPIRFGVRADGAVDDDFANMDHGGDYGFEMPGQRFDDEPDMMMTDVLHPEPVDFPDAQLGSQPVTPGATPRMSLASDGTGRMSFGSPIQSPALLQPERETSVNFAHREVVRNPAAKKRAPAKRKARPEDENIELTNAELHANIQNTSDLVLQSRSFRRPHKKFLHMKSLLTSLNDDVFLAPTSEDISDDIGELFRRTASRHLSETLAKMPNVREASVQPHEFLRTPQVGPSRSVTPRATSPSLSFAAPSASSASRFTVAPAGTQDDDFGGMQDYGGGFDMPDEDMNDGRMRSTTPLHVIPSPQALIVHQEQMTSPASHGRLSFSTHPEALYRAATPLDRMMSPSPLRLQSSREASLAPSEVSLGGAGPSEEIQRLETAGFNRGTARMVAHLRNKLLTAGVREILLEDAVPSKSRRAAASCFFESLVLKTKHCVDVKQAEAYASISIVAKDKLFEVAGGV